MEVPDLIQLQPYDDMYQTLMQERIFNSVVKTMFGERSVPIKDNLLGILRKHFMRSRNPNTTDISVDEDITWLAKDNRQSKYDLVTKLNKTKYTNTTKKCFTNEFIELYLVRAYAHFVEHENSLSIAESKDYEWSGVYQVNQSVTYATFVDLLYREPQITFALPSNLVSSTRVDLTSPNVQYMEFSNNSSSAQKYCQFRYEYVCRNSKCKSTVKYDDFKGVVCDSCHNFVRPLHNEKNYHNFYVISIYYENNPMTLLSLVPVGIGDFTAAVIFTPVGEDHVGFILGIKETEYPAEQVSFDTHQHMAFAITDYLDRKHLRDAKTGVDGMHWIKASMVMAEHAGMGGDSSNNVLIVGDKGTGKSMTVSMYMYSMSKNSRLQNSSSATASGLIGNAVTIKIGKNTINLIRPGKLSTYDNFGMDEFYSNQKINGELKSALSSQEVNKCNAVADFTHKKTAIIFGTANVNSEHLLRVRKLASDLVRRANDEYNFCDYHPALYPVWKKYGGKDMSRLVEEGCIAIEHSRDVCWIDGLELAVLDRFPFLFYIHENTKTGGITSRRRGSDTPYDTFEVNNAIFSPAVRELLQERSKIKATIPDEIYTALEKVFDEELLVHDRIHSEGRLWEYVETFVKASAAINGRSVATYYDALFVKHLFMHTSRFMEQRYFVKDSLWDGYIDEDSAKQLLLQKYDRLSFVYNNSYADMITGVVPGTLDYDYSNVVKKEECVQDDHSVEYIPYSDSARPVPFTDAPDGSSPSTIVEYLERWFTECRYLTEKDLEYLTEQHGVDRHGISLAVGSMCLGGYVKKDEQIKGYRIC